MGIYCAERVLLTELPELARKTAQKKKSSTLHFDDVTVAEDIVTRRGADPDTYLVSP